MRNTLTFGVESAWHLDVQNVTRLAPAEIDCLPDVAASIFDALQRPLNFPLLSQATVPGDQVVVALQPAMPCADEVACGLARALVDAGVEPENTTILVADPGTLQSIQSGLTKEHFDEIGTQLHDPTNKDGCAYLGVTSAGRPLRMNRALCDADFVLPVGIASPEYENQSVHFWGLFPDFSDADAIERFQVPIAYDNSVHREGRRKEVLEADKMLGVCAVVQVVPAAQGNLAALFAGDPASVAEVASKAYQAIWMPAFDRQADLAVALLTGNKTQQSWQNVGLALQAADAVLKDGGTVVLCTELEHPPSPSLLRLCDANDTQSTQHDIYRDRYPDSWSAIQMAKALDRGAVYLHSRLPETIVESMGLTPIASSKELERLIQRHQHCALLDDSQRLKPRLAKEMIASAVGSR